MPVKFSAFDSDLNGPEAPNVVSEMQAERTQGEDIKDE